MIYISHRGFINGKDTKLENNPDQINYLLEQNINVEHRQDMSKLIEMKNRM